MNEIQLAEGSICIGDLHLDPSRPESADELAAFLARRADAPTLVVLGDLFEAWIGPAHARLPGAARVIAALRDWSDGGRALHLVPGNRDFLLGDDFERATGAR